MTTTLYVPGTDEKDHKKQNMSLQLIGGQTATNTDAIATINAATYVNSIAGNHGAFTLNATTGITNSANDIQLEQASASQFGAVKVDGTTITASGGVISASVVAASPIHASLAADVLLNNTANYFDGPSIAQGTTGTWFVSGSITVFDASGAAFINAKLWDGTTVIASTQVKVPAGSSPLTISLSGYIASPAGNLRISAQDATSANGKIFFNQSGNSKDSTISAFRIA